MNEQQVSEIHAIEAEFDNPDARNTWYMALEIHRLRAEIARLRTALSKQNDEICQTLGLALGYPKFCDDQANFPGATETNGVCVGDHVAESIAVEAAGIIGKLRAAEAAAFRRGVEAARAQIFTYITDMEVPASGGDDYRAGWSDGAAEVQADIAALPPPEDKP